MRKRLSSELSAKEKLTDARLPLTVNLDLSRMLLPMQILLLQRRRLLVFSLRLLTELDLLRLINRYLTFTLPFDQSEDLS